MGRILKWFGLALGGVLGVVVLAVAGMYLSATMRLNKTYTVQPATVTVPSGSAAIERGRHWASVSCANCHGEDLAGTVFFDDPSLGRIPAPNLTRGKGGIGAEYAEADWVRAIRHGVRPDGKPLLIMPAESFYWFGDDDLGAIIAYVKSVPPVDQDVGRYAITPLARLLIVAGAFGNIMSAEVVDHSGARPAAPRPEATAAYGEYIVKTGGCRTCHGPELSGGKDPNPAAPPAPNLTPTGDLGNWNEQGFLAVMRGGENPWMPFKYFGRLSDDELKALWAYLRSLPAREDTMP